MIHVMKAKTSRSPGNVPQTWALELGGEIRRWRKHLRLTQRKLADLAQCGPDFLYDLERGKPSVRLDKLVSVLDVLGLRLKVEPRVAGTGTVVGDWISPMLTAKR
jgi:HTH-type transcriptional regulator/antitoxin HipB